MPELSHDAAEDGFHEIQLSGKQIVFLFMVLTVASAVIFLSGVLVGRGVRSQRGEGVDTPAVATSATAPQAVSEVTPSAEPPAPATETPDELSYPKRLQGEGATETAKPESARAETARPETGRPDTPPTSPPAAPATSQAPAAAPPAAAETQNTMTAGPAASPQAPIGGRAGAWVVQVGAFGNAGAARDVVRRLSSKGYRAFLVNPSPGMPAIYRVQVGAYNNRSEADQVARRIEKEEQFKPVVRQNR